MTTTDIFVENFNMKMNGKPQNCLRFYGKLLSDKQKRYKTV